MAIYECDNCEYSRETSRRNIGRTICCPECGEENQVISELDIDSDGPSSLLRRLAWGLIANLGWSLLVLAGIFALVIAIAVMTPDPKPAPSRPSAVRIDKSPEKQAARKQMIDAAIEEYRYCTKVGLEAGRPFVRVTPRFRVQSREEQVALLQVVYGYYLSDEFGSVLIFDSTGTKRVGQYTLYSGIEYD